MSDDKKKEFTEEEKALFLMSNTKLAGWYDKQLVIEFSKLAKANGSSQKDVLTKFMTKYVEKYKTKGE